MKSIAVVITAIVLSSCAHMRVAPLDGSCPDDFPIKGNADSYLYHFPDSPYYYKTKAELCFSNAESAKALGFHVAFQCSQNNCKRH